MRSITGAANRYLRWSRSLARMRCRDYAAGVLSVDQWPELSEPLMVIALTGWVDAGGAGAGAMTALAEQLDDARTSSARSTSPHARGPAADPPDARDGRRRASSTGRASLRVRRARGGREGAGRDIVLVRGPEPSLRWPTLASSDRRCRPPSRRAPSGDARGNSPRSSRTARPRSSRVGDPAITRAGVGPAAPDYAGPTGLQTVMLRALGDAGIPGAGLWAQVPQYVAGSPSPPASARCSPAWSRSTTSISTCARSTSAARPTCDGSRPGSTARPDVKAVVDQIDERQEGDTGDLVAEIEQFLRSQPGTDGA